MRTAVRPHHFWVWMGILAGLVWTGARVAVPALTGQAIDEGIVPGNFDVALEWTAIILAVGVVQAICTGLRRYSAFRLAYRVETDLRMRLVAHLQRLHFAFHDHAQTGQLMANANTDIQQIQQVVLLIPLTIASVLTMIAVVVVLVLTSPAARVVRARGVAVLEHRGDAFHAPHVSGRALVAAGARRPVGGRRRERVGCARREGLRRGTSAGAAPRPSKPTTCSTVRSTRPGCARTSCR